MIYMDNAAATRVDERVFDAMKPYFFENYAVATSEFGYSQGIEAREALGEARTKIASHLGAIAEEIIFTSGSTESSNIALKGVAKALGEKKGKHLIISQIEDFPVLYSAKALEREGFRVDYLPVDEFGIVNIGELEQLIGKQTILVSIQHGNQEIGTVQDIKAIGKLCKEKGVLFHTDATHTFGRIPLNVKDINVDLITISANTIHGPKGVGGLYVKKGTKIEKVTEGGFQEGNLRPGIENIPGAIGFAKAIELIGEAENNKLEKMRDYIIKNIGNKVPNITLNGHPQKRLPQNANITFHYIEGESITLHLDMYGIAVSTGSACFSRSLEASHVITAIGGDHERAHGSIRFTLGRYNSFDEIDDMVEKIAKIVEELRKISPLGKEGGNEMTFPYNEIVLKHFRNPHNVGSIENPDGKATEGSPACGDMVSVYLKVDSETQVIVDIKFESYGCASNIATGSIITDLAKGKTIEEAKKISWKQASEALGGLPPIKAHCSVLAVEGLKQAILNYEEKHGIIAKKETTTEETVRKRLKRVMNPMKGLDMVATDLVKKIEVENGIIEIEIDLPENHQFANSIKEEAREKLETLWDVEEVIITFAK